MPKQKHQSSLDSFFGVPDGKKVKTQRTLTSFFHQKDKENKTNDDSDDDDSSDDDGVYERRKITTTSTARSKSSSSSSSSVRTKKRGSPSDDATKKNQTKKSKTNSSTSNKTKTTVKSDKPTINRRRPVLEDSEDDDDDDYDNDGYVDFDEEEKDVEEKNGDDNSDDDDNSEQKKKASPTTSTKKIKSEEPDENSNEMDEKDDQQPVVATAPIKKEGEGELAATNEKSSKKKKNKQDNKDDNTTSSKSVAPQPVASSTTAAATTPATSTTPPVSDTPGRLKLVARAKKIAKAYKVEPDIGASSLSSSSGTAKDESLELSSPVPYADLVQVLEDISATTKRLEIQAILTKFLRRVLHYSPSDINSVVYLASNSVAPAYDCVELGIGDSILIKAISEAYGSNDKTVKALYEKEGDLGTVAQSCKSKQRTLAFAIKKASKLSSAQVLTVFREIAQISGSKSQKLKIDKIKKLLVGVSNPAETKYIIRGLQGKLRIGLAESTVLISLAHAFTMTIPATVQVPPNPVVVKQEDTGDDGEDEDETMEETSSYKNDPIVKALLDESLPVEKTLEAASNMIRKVYSEVPSFDALLSACIKVSLADLHSVCHFQPGIPVVPMLAKPTKSVQEVLKRLDGQEFTCEYKYDGERAQIHMTPDGTLKVFSRNMLETSMKYPEVPLFVQEAAKKACDIALSSKKNATTATKEESPGDDDDKKTDAGAGVKTEELGDAAGGSGGVTSFVLDAEVVAFNRQTGQLVPFQVLSTRKKEMVDNETAKVQVIVQAFDLMYLNGKSLLATSLKERRTLLQQYFAPVENKFQFATSLDVVDDGDTTQLEQFLDQAVKGQCEGLMVKTMDDVYEPSRRSLNWLKLKKDYLEGLGDSFDLVVLGAYYGKGKRTGVYGAYLLACYDEETEEFQSVCKIGTGFSDEDLQTLSAELNNHRLEGGKSSQYLVSSGLECDVWFDAVQVWEVKAADLSKSSSHRGAYGKVDEGRGIGLRFPRFERVREDKAPEQATNSDQVLDMYYNQDTVKGGDGYDDDEDGI